MKGFLYFSIFLSLSLASCNQSDITDTNAALLAGVPSVQTSSQAPLSDMSLYNLESEWKNQQSESIKLPQLQGKVQLVAMVYTSCTYACPRIVADLKRIEASIEKYKNDEVGIVLVTMDPERDTPEKLKEFAIENKLDANRWTLLTSDEANIQELAVLLNMKYKNGGNGEIAHSNIITVLNRAGEIIHQQEGLGKDPDETVKSIEGLLKQI